MRRLQALLLLGVALSGWAQAGTTLPRTGIYKPACREEHCTGTSALYDRLDTYVGYLDKTGTWTAQQTFGLPTIVTRQATNFVQVFDNDTGGSFSCAANGISGALTLIDTDGTSADQWVLCDGTSERFKFNTSGTVTTPNGTATLSTGGGGGGSTTAFLTIPAGASAATLSSAGVPANNNTRCAAFVPQLSINNATKIGFGIAAVGTGAVGMAIYDAAGTTRIATTGGVTNGALTANSPVVVSGITAFSLTSGTKYLLCWTASTTDTTFATVGTANGNGRFVRWITSQNMGTASNNGSGGSPPTTTGGLTADNTNDGPVPVVVISVE